MYWGGIVGFIVHAVLILLGVRIAKVQGAGFGMCLVVALLSYLLMWVLKVGLFPLFFLPLLSGLLAAAVLLFGTALAAKLVLDIEWGPAWTIGVVVALVNAVLNWIF